MLNAVRDELLDYASFVSFIKDKIGERMGKGYDVRVYKIVKNNSHDLDSLIVLKEGRNFAPNIYLKAYYESYLLGTSLAEILERLCMIYKYCAIPIIDEDFEYSLEAMRPYIFFRLINFERNRKFLTQIPYIEFLDLAITFHCLARNEDDSISTIRITNEHMRLWDITTKELKELAFNNTRRLFPPSLRSMKEIMEKFLYNDYMDVKSNEPYPIYILTNKKGINGASCMLYKDVIREFARLVNSDIYIIPSSIHEIILIPMENSPDKNYFNRLVLEINSSSLSVDEVLSDHVYIYSLEKDRIIM